MGRANRDELPELFCWTRFGVEAAEPVNEILLRKEKERLANGGLFLWGIGNALGPSIRELTRRTTQPEVIFSPIKSNPKLSDQAPDAIVAWTSAEGIDGNHFPIPPHSRVISKYNPDAPRPCHYALVCFSDEPLIPLRSESTVEFAQLRNLRTGRPVGASQVTAIVEKTGPTNGTTTAYEVAIRAQLVYPYFVRLLDAVDITMHEVHVRSHQA
jgi:hypothetical protein